MKKNYTLPCLSAFLICILCLQNKTYALSATGFDDNFPGGNIECGSHSLDNSSATAPYACEMFDGYYCPSNGQTNYYQDCSYTTNSDGSLCTTSSCTCWGSNEKTIYAQFCPEIDGEYDFNVTNISCSGGTSALQFQIMSGASTNNSICDLTSIHCNSGTTSNTSFSLNLLAGECYTILFDGGAAANCTWDFNIECANNLSSKLKNEKQYLSLFPNPIKNSLNIEFPIPFEIGTEVLIFNLMGGVVYNQIITVNKTALKIDLDNISRGIYFIQIKSNNINLQQRFYRE